MRLVLSHRDDERMNDLLCRVRKVSGGVVYSAAFVRSNAVWIVS